MFSFKPHIPALQQNSFQNFSKYLYMNIFSRMDSILIGVLAAILHFQYKEKLSK